MSLIPKIDRISNLNAFNAFQEDVVRASEASAAFIALLESQIKDLEEQLKVKRSSEKSWGFRSPQGSTDIVYAGGFYQHSGAANDFSAGPTFGTANASYAAHFFVVLGAATVDILTLTVTGTSINDDGTRVAADSQNIVIPSGAPVDSYYETPKKWLGTVTITVASGTAKTCDFGFSKYWDNNNSDFSIEGLEVTWLAGANANVDIKLCHHKGAPGNRDWTYTGSGATPPTAIATLAGDHSTEDQVVNDECGAWKRSNLDVFINGGGADGILVELHTDTQKAFELGTFLMRIKT